MFTSRIVEPVLNLPRVTKRAVALLVDACLCVLTVWLAFSLRVGEWVPLSANGWPAAMVSLAIALPIFVVLGLYRAVFRYVSWDALVTITQAVFLYGIIYSAVFTAFSIPGVPRTVGVIQPVLLLIAIGGSRALSRYVLGGRYRQRRGVSRRNILIYGAGSAGRQLAGALDDTQDTRVVGFIDDDPNLHGTVIGRIRVLGGEGCIPAAVARLDVSEILLAIPSAGRSRRNKILNFIRPLGISVRTLPGLLDIAHGNVTVSDIKPLEIEDILGRDTVAPDVSLMERDIRDRVVLVTGAGGSIGSELCRQILTRGPARLLLVDSSEFALYAIHKELGGTAQENGLPADDIVPLLASVTDEQRMRAIFSAWTPHTIYHAAAYKHVPLVEHNPIEGVRNNVIGTLTCARMAEQFGSTSFVLVSTDKAVRPTNIMGASKRLAEMVLQAIAAERPQTRFSMVRFGNVLNSSGSVVPLFRQQIAAGGPVTVTHRAVTRYFMTIPEAAQLVIQAGSMGEGGEVFVLDMGEPVKVLDLAIRMIELSGLKVRDPQNLDGDIEIIFNGLRPGEKLYEELLIGDSPAATPHPQVMMAREKFLPMSRMVPELEDLNAALDRQDVGCVRDMIRCLVPDYAASEHVVDWVFKKTNQPQPIYIEVTEQQRATP